MQMQKVRIIMDRDGIRRLERAGSSLLSKPLQTWGRVKEQRPSVFTGATPRIQDPFGVAVDAKLGRRDLQAQHLSVNMVPQNTSLRDTHT